MNVHVAVPTAPELSRIAVLSASYDRWIAFYDHVSDRRDAAERRRSEGVKQLEDAATMAVNQMNNIFDEVMMTPATGVHDLGLKARMVQEFMRSEWYCHDANLDRGELLARAMMIELMAMAGLAPITRPNWEPNDLLPGYVEPGGVERVFLQAAE